MHHKHSYGHISDLCSEGRHYQDLDECEWPLLLLVAYALRFHQQNFQILRGYQTPRIRRKFLFF